HIEAGAGPAEAAGRALATIGRAVLTAGATVVVALLALLVFQVPSVSAMAYAVVVVVAAVVLSALTLQPAIIGAVGTRLVSPRVPWARQVASGAQEQSGLRRWADVVTAKAPVWLVVAV